MTENEIKILLGKLLLHYPMTNMTTHEKTMLLEDYIADLRPFPLGILAGVCRKYRLDPQNQFFPKIGQLVSFCVSESSPLRKRQRVLQEALNAKPEEPKKTVTAQDWENLRRQLAGEMKSP